MAVEGGMANEKTYRMEETSEVAAQAAQIVEEFLRRQPRTVEVRNVENDPQYQAQDIDLLWMGRTDDGALKTVRIEVKGDRYHTSGNYFFETISNEGKGTPGCFLYTCADYIYYLFVDIRELHILPMPATRDWFLPKLQTFRERKTTTPTTAGKRYYTVGRLVPKALVKAQVPGVVVRVI
ncbi:MAG: hypothetical protein ACO1OQ_16850 [Rufibacter sp.]